MATRLLPHSTPDTRAYDAAVETALQTLHVSIERSFDEIRLAIVAMLDQLVAAGAQHTTPTQAPAPASLTTRVRSDETCH
jgi:hypothetical protein